MTWELFHSFIWMRLLSHPSYHFCFQSSWATTFVIHSLSVTSFPLPKQPALVLMGATMSPSLCCSLGTLLRTAPELWLGYSMQRIVIYIQGLATVERNSPPYQQLTCTKNTSAEVLRHFSKSPCGRDNLQPIGKAEVWSWGRLQLFLLAHCPCTAGQCKMFPLYSWDDSSSTVILGMGKPFHLK